MSEINAKLKGNLLVIEKNRIRQTEEDIEIIDVTLLKLNKVYKSGIKMSNNTQKDKILLLEDYENLIVEELKPIDEDEMDNIESDDIESDDIESDDIEADDIENEEVEYKKKVVLVYSEGKKIKYCYTDIDRAYKKLVSLKYKVLNIKLTRKKVKLVVLVYIINKYNLNITRQKFMIGNNNYIKSKVNIYNSKRKSKINLIFKKNIHKYQIPILDIVNKSENINNNIKFNLQIEDVQFEYKIGIKNKKIKVKKYYNLPMMSKYIKDYAIHIRRTIAGNLIVVSRLVEPIEKTFRFKFFESKAISGILYKTGKILEKIRKRKINIFYEKFASKSEEGVLELSQICMSSSKTKNYFVIDKDSDDYERIKECKNIVKKYSLKYYWLIYNCTYFIASEAPSHLNVLRSNNKYFRKATYDKKFIFLQHGIIYMKDLGQNSSFKKGKEGESKYIIASSEKEKDVIVDMLGHNEEQILKTGLAMYSNIEYNHINNNSEDKVTIMLTWKPYEEALYNFEESTYYQFTIEIYNMITKYINKEKVRIVAHPKVYELLKDTDIGNSIWQGKISDALKDTKLYITDYSSACYNAFYQGAGIIFYQPDLERYELENGKLVPNNDEYVGLRAFNIEELENIIKETIKENKIDLSKVRAEEFEERYKTINEFSDGKNIDRIFDKLKELKIV